MFNGKTTNADHFIKLFMGDILADIIDKNELF